MKTENNLENKAAFFAQYWNQKVWLTNENDYHYSVGVSLDVNYVEETDFLELTPLSQISDEDIDVIDLPYISIKDHLLNDIISQYEADYLRSKGYAVPWRDLSVDDLIAYGWVKLKTE